MKTDKTKCLQILTDLSNKVYDCEQLLNSVKTTQESVKKLSLLADMLQEVNEVLRKLLDDDWWT